MARWVDATDDQKFWQYTVPAARRRTAAGEWLLCMQQAQDKADAAQARLALHEPDTLEYSSTLRYLDELRSDYRHAREQLRFDEAILAKAQRLSSTRAKRGS